MRSYLSVYGATMLGTAVGLTLMTWGILVLGDVADEAMTGRAGPSPVDRLRPAVGWAVQALTAASALWLASVRCARRGRPWLAAGIALALLAVWTASAFAPSTVDNVVLPWPGVRPPVFPSEYYATRTVAHPAVLSPLALGLSSVGVAWVATRLGRAVPGVERRVTSRAGTLIAVGLVGVPALVALAGGLAAYLRIYTTGPGGWRLVEILPWGDVVLPPTMAVLLVVVAAVVSGDGRATALPLAFGWAITFVPVLSQWYAGGDDGLLLGASAVLAAVALAWSWRPVARHLQDALAEQRPPTA